jgi:hypothetical protein
MFDFLWGKGVTKPREAVGIAPVKAIARNQARRLTP